MDSQIVGQPPAVCSPQERAVLIAQSLRQAARNARFSTKRRRTLSGGNVRAKRAERLWRLVALCTFAGFVGLPSFVFAGYIFLIASPQYSAEARFTVRGGVPVDLAQMSSLGTVPAALIVQDTQVILSYLQSRALVERLQETVGLEQIFENRTIDWPSRLRPMQPIEKVVAYWKRRISLSVQMPSGIVIFTVRAFSPESAVTISQAALAASEQLVNEMNDKMRADAVSLAERERRHAQATLGAARADLERARNEEGLLSAKDQSAALTGLVQSVQGEAIKMQQAYAAQLRYVRADAPQLRALRVRIEASQREIAALRAQMTSRGSVSDTAPVLSASMSRLDAAGLESTIAERIYAASLGALEQARVASESKLMYVDTFVRPVAAQRADYPRRGLDMLVFVSASGGLWLALIGGLRFVINSRA